MVYLTIFSATQKECGRKRSHPNLMYNNCVGLEGPPWVRFHYRSSRRLGSAAVCFPDPPHSPNELRLWHTPDCHIFIRALQQPPNVFVLKMASLVVAESQEIFISLLDVSWKMIRRCVLFKKNQLGLMCCYHDNANFIHMNTLWHRTCSYLLAYKTWQQYIK